MSTQQGIHLQRKHERSSSGAKWMQLEDITLSTINQTQNTNAARSYLDAEYYWHDAAVVIMARNIEAGWMVVTRMFP